MKYFIQIKSRVIKAARFDFFGAGKWVEDLPLIAIDYGKKTEIAACGKEALKYISVPQENIVVCNPFESLEAWIADLEYVETYIRWFQQRYLIKKWALCPPLVVVQPVGYGRALFEVERRAIKESFIHAGAREVWLLAEETKVSLENLRKMKRQDLQSSTLLKPKIPSSIVTDW